MNTSSEINATILGDVKFYQKESCVEYRWNPGTHKESENVAPVNPHQNGTYVTSIEIASS